MLLADSKVPIPADAHVTMTTGEVKQWRHIDGKRWPEKILIGKIPIHSPTYKPQDYINPDGVRLMIPNDKYRVLYKDEYAQYLKENQMEELELFPPETINVGWYLLILGVAYKLGVYQLLCEIFGNIIANAIMDLAMYYIVSGNNAINKMEKRMADSLMFSIQPRRDDWYSKLFGSFAVDYKAEAPFGDHSVREFMIRWIELRKADGLSDVFISLDGTNLDCQSIFNPEAQQGHAKTGKKVNIVGVMSAVVANGDNKGMPLAYTIDPGSRPDMSTSQELLAFFSGMGMDPLGLIADRGFSYNDVMDLCDEMKLPFVMPLKDIYTACNYMLDKYGKEIFWNFNYWIEGSNSLFGISEDNVQIFSNNSQNPARKGCVALFFDGTRSSIQNTKFLKGFNVELASLKREVNKYNKSGVIQTILNSVESSSDDQASKSVIEERIFSTLSDAKITVDAKYCDYIEIVYDSVEEKALVVTSRDAMMKKFEGLGYSTIASSVKRSAQEISEIYDFRDTSEKRFSSMKTELGFRTARVKGEPRFHGKYFTCFIADIIRNEIEHVFQRYKEKKHCTIDTNPTIIEFKQIGYTRSGSHYIYSGQTSVLQREILEELGITKEALKTLSPLIEVRICGNGLDRFRSEMRVIPVAPKTKSLDMPKQENGRDQSSSDSSLTKSDAAESESSGNVTKRRGGRKKGSKNKKTLQREKEAAAERERRIAEGLPPEEPKKRGRKPGSKNKKTIERENQARAERERRVAAGLPPEESKPANKGGRPKGSKNKKTLLREAEEQARRDASDASPTALQTEGKIRLGSKYKTTLMQEEYDRKLFEQTGIDIIGNPPPRPWTRAVRQAENRRRKKLRDAAEEKLRELRATKIPDPDQ